MKRNDRSYPYLLVRHMPTIYTRHPIPEGLDLAGAILHARQEARRRRQRVCLVLGTERTVFISKAGDIEGRSDRVPDRR